jgi:hypothetical protein
VIPPVIGRYIEGLKAHDVDRVAGTVADDLAFVTPPRTMTKPQFLAFLRGALRRVPGLAL